MVTILLGIVKLPVSFASSNPNQNNIPTKSVIISSARTVDGSIGINENNENAKPNSTLNKYNIVADEIKRMVQNAPGKIIKVIIESGILSKNEIITATKLVEDSGAHFVKTSTGLSAFGASPEIIKSIKTTLKSDTKIKASGGIKSLNQVEELIDAGADRIGSSSGIIIMEEITNK